MSYVTFCHGSFFHYPIASNPYAAISSYYSLSVVSAISLHRKLSRREWDSEPLTADHLNILEELLRRGKVTMCPQFRAVG